ncbi:DUF2730 family protein [Alcaligenaceae bacterium]|nr:DUF2730 family protein [Alcaligenaceae bacterium]
MELTNITFGFEAMRWIVVTVIGIYAWVIGRQSASAKEMLDLRTRITKLESDIRQTPSQQQFHELSLRVEKVNGAVDGVREGLTPMRESLRRVEGFLLNKGD